MYRPAIATGVGGGAGWQALAWALEELVGPPLAARAVAAAKTRPGGNRVTPSVHTGRVDHALVRTSAHAGPMVIAACGRTTHQGATHAHCPVVVVRPDTSARQGPFAGHVVVGVDGSTPARAALAFGFSYAATARRPLAAVQVPAHDGIDIWVDDRMLETHLNAEPATLAKLSAEVEPWAYEYPAVAVKRAVFADRPLPGPLRAAAGARILNHATGPLAVAHKHDATTARLAPPHLIGERL